jgi:molybdate/tungstate transport system substrate-binding protein
MPTSFRRALAPLLPALGLAAIVLTGCSSKARPTPLVVFNAGSLAAPFRDLLAAFQADNPAAVPAQEISGSLEAARKVTELGKVPDVLAVADYAIIDRLLRPAHATWQVMFARNAMVLAYTDRSVGAGEVNGANWWQVLLRPDVRVGRSDPALDPSGYRALMVLQLAEKHYAEPGLAAKLTLAMPARYVRPKEADLTALLQAGELDYAWTYRSIAQTTGLRFVELPKEIDLGDPALADAYAVARVMVPGAKREGGEMLELAGEPIVYALTIPSAAPHPELARAFVRFALSAEGRAIIAKNGLVPIAPVVKSGEVPAEVLE